MLRWLVAGLLLGCGAEEAAPAPVETVEVAEPVPEDDLLEEDDELPDEAPPSYSTEELDAMERPELEQACFTGSQAACDRLGH